MMAGQEDSHKRRSCNKWVPQTEASGSTHARRRSGSTGGLKKLSTDTPIPGASPAVRFMTIRQVGAAGACAVGLVAALIGSSPIAWADPALPPPPAPVVDPPPVPAPPVDPAAAPLAGDPAPAPPADPGTPPAPDAVPQSAPGEAGPPEGVPHLPSPENLPPGTAAAPTGPQRPRMGYLRELWEAMKTQDVTMSDALLLLTQRPLDANAVPPPGKAAGPNPVGPQGQPPAPGAPPFPAEAVPPAPGAPPAPAEALPPAAPDAVPPAPAEAAPPAPPAAPPAPAAPPPAPPAPGAAPGPALPTP